MCTLKLAAHLSGAELKARMQQAGTKELYRRWQCLYLTQSYEVTAAYLSDLSGLSTSAIYLLMKSTTNKDPAVWNTKPEAAATMPT